MDICDSIVATRTVNLIHMQYELIFISKLLSASVLNQLSFVLKLEMQVNNAKIGNLNFSSAYSIKF